MNKKLLVILMAAVIAAVFLTACNEQPPRHIHEYSSKVTEPTCLERGYNTYTCECGKSYISDYTQPLGHNYVDKVCTRCGWIEHEHNYETTVVQPTCTESGYTFGKCTGCGANYKIHFVDPLGHDYENGYCKRCGYFDRGKHEHNYESAVTSPTCTEQGYTTYTCTECGHSYTDNYIDMLEHNFVDGNCTYCNLSQYTEGLAYVDRGTYAECAGYKYISADIQEKEIIIASSFNGKPVTAIAADAFSSCKRIEKVVLPDKVTSIGAYAFGWCTSLSEIVLPVGLNYIEEGAFKGCSSLTEIVMSDYVFKIGSNAFDGCVSLSKIVMSATLQTIGLAAFKECNSLKEIVIPDSVSALGNYAFYGCENLQKITLSAGVFELESYTFASCPNLKDIYFKGTKEQWKALPHTDWLYWLTDCTIHCTDGDVIVYGRNTGKID